MPAGSGVPSGQSSPAVAEQTVCQLNFQRFEAASQRRSLLPGNSPGFSTIAPDASTAVTTGSAPELSIRSRSALSQPNSSGTVLPELTRPFGNSMP